MRSALVVGLVTACFGCEDDRQTEIPTASVTEPRLVETAAPSVAPSSAAPAVEPPPFSCQAPSLSAKRPIDGSTTAALSTCVPVRTGEERYAHKCGQRDEPPVDLTRLRRAVLAFDAATHDRVLELYDAGQKAGRNPRAFGLVGDSMTVSDHFLRAFSARSGGLKMRVDADLMKTLTLEANTANVIDFFRGATVDHRRGHPDDAFRAKRAAQVGARASWALRGTEGIDLEHSPVAEMIREISPAFAIVLYGGNDAAYRVASPEELADSFEGSFVQLLDALERNGIIPIVSTLARHAHQPGVQDCVGATHNWRIAVATNAINRRVVEIACERHLPLIDLRDAMDALPNHGLGPDGVHPSWYRVDGAGILDERGLQCGYNVRNYLTLLMLKQVIDLLQTEGRRLAD